MSEWLFEVQDRNGNWVRLSRARWVMHIVEKHSEVGPFVEEIKNVIRFPGIITEEAGGDKLHLATFGVAGGKYRNCYLEIVVRYQGSRGNKSGIVLTVHFNTHPPKGDLQWLTRS